jgi:hypothetical protein
VVVVWDMAKIDPEEFGVYDERFVYGAFRIETWAASSVVEWR